jgi:benzoyl-CoA reductase/2-hydroxyglutaryl-CoA dehydratase subunit BcrC/BadD/HgdB
MNNNTANSRTVPAAVRELPAMFESFGEARWDGFLAMKSLKDSGKGVVGTFCTYVPAELIMAAGLIPVGLCSTSDETIVEAEKTLPGNLCPLIKASYGFAITDKCPYMYFPDLVVGETTCDGKIKMYELLAQKKDVYVMDLPRTQHKESSRTLWLAEICAFLRRGGNDQPPLCHYSGCGCQRALFWERPLKSIISL